MIISIRKSQRSETLTEIIYPVKVKRHSITTQYLRWRHVSFSSIRHYSTLLKLNPSHVAFYSRPNTSKGTNTRRVNASWSSVPLKQSVPINVFVARVCRSVDSMFLGKMTRRGQSSNGRVANECKGINGHDHHSLSSLCRAVLPLPYATFLPAVFPYASSIATLNYTLIS